MVRVLLVTTKYYTPYCKVLLQFGSCSTKYYSSTTLQNIALVRTTNSVLRRSKKYCSILQSTTPVHTTKITTPVLLCTSQISPNAAPATKIDPPTSPNNSLAKRSDTPTWPNIAPATKSDTVTVDAVTSDHKLRSQATKNCGHKRPPAPMVTTYPWRIHGTGIFTYIFPIHLSQM